MRRARSSVQPSEPSAREVQPARVGASPPGNEPAEISQRSASLKAPASAALKADRVRLRGQTCSGAVACAASLPARSGGARAWRRHARSPLLVEPGGRELRMPGGQGWESVPWLPSPRPGQRGAGRTAHGAPRLAPSDGNAFGTPPQDGTASAVSGAAADLEQRVAAEVLRQGRNRAKYRADFHGVAPSRLAAAAGSATKLVVLRRSTRTDEPGRRAAADLISNQQPSIVLARDRELLETFTPTPESGENDACGRSS